MLILNRNNFIKDFASITGEQNSLSHEHLYSYRNVHPRAFFTQYICVYSLNNDIKIVSLITMDRQDKWKFALIFHNKYLLYTSRHPAETWHSYISWRAFDANKQEVSAKGVAAAEAGVGPSDRTLRASHSDSFLRRKENVITISPRLVPGDKADKRLKQL